MRISDWSSDVCSSDLGGLVLGSFFGALRIMQGAHFLSQVIWSLALVWCLCSVLFYPLIVKRHRAAPDNADGYHLDDNWKQIGRTSGRERVFQSAKIWVAPYSLI